METQKALDIKQALITLSDALGMEFNQIASRICFLDKDKGAILREASDTWNKFDNASIVERGEMLGINITVTDESETSI